MENAQNSSDWKVHKTESTQKMSGWKTKTGTVLLATGSILLGSADLVPAPTVMPWLKFIGTVLTGIGGSLTAWGVGHKIEKNKTL